MEFDYSYVPTAARIAVYDDLLSAPRIVQIEPAETHEFINTLASKVYELASAAGGGIPYTAVKQVAENSIHAKFQEIVVSILDKGNTIRFTDQGPGIADKQAALRPGFSSATDQMKRYIDGVGSGLPIVHEYLDIKNGSLLIEDNINGGSVITLSLSQNPVDGRPMEAPQTGNAASPSIEAAPAVGANETARDADAQARFIAAALPNRRRQVLSILLQDDVLGVKDISTITGIPLSSTHAELQKLEEAGLVDMLGKKRILTPLGRDVAAVL